MTWRVLHHSPLEKLDDHLWMVEGAVPGIPLRRRMLVIRLTDGRLVVHNAIAMGPDEQRKLEALGELAFIVVPNGWHRLDAPRYHERYPSAKLVCPDKSRARVAKVVPVDGGYDALPKDRSFSWETIEGCRPGEAVFRVHGDKETLVFGDMLMNNPHAPGFWWTVYRLTGSTGGPRVTGLMRLAGVSSGKAVRAHYERLASEPCERVIPGHGLVLEGAAARDALRTAAERL